MRIAGLLHESIVDGPGVRFVVFCQGCPHRCPGCHNPETWDFGGGGEYTVRQLIKEIRKAPALVRGVTLSGGEPFSQPGEMAQLASRVHGLGMDVVTYTGFLYEELLEKARKDPEVERLLAERQERRWFWTKKNERRFSTLRFFIANSSSAFKISETFFSDTGIIMRP